MTDKPARKIVILGALSAMAVQSARRFAAEGASFTLVARDTALLEREAQDLGARGAARVDIVAADLTDTADADGLLRQAAGKMGGLDTVLLFYGVLGDQARAETDADHAGTIIAVNYSSAAQWVLAAARILEQMDAPGGRVLLTASSVAGDRGRRSNYVYGSAKAGLSVLMQGLAHKWAAMPNAPRAVNLRLGFVDTPMTADVEKTAKPLWATPERIALIVERCVKRPGPPTVYAPWFWRWVMVLIRLMPSPVFNKVNL